MARERVGMALIGAGHWGPNLIRNFSDHDSSELLWVVDLDTRRLDAVKARFPSVGVTSDPKDVIRDDNVAAIVVSTPTSTHFDLAKIALEQGKHVLVEKPMTADVSQAEDLAEMADRLGLVLLVGHVFLYNTAVRKVKEFIDSGQLGRIYYVSMIRTNLGPIRVDVNAAWDLASHDISIANYWLESEPLTVSSLGGNWINPGIEDAVFATFQYPESVIVNVHASWLNPRKTRDITVVGDRKMLTFDDLNFSEPIRIYDKGVSEERTTPAFVDTFASFRASVREGDITIPNVALGEPLREECDHFLQCITAKVEPLTDGRSGAAVVRALDAMKRSMGAGGREETISAGARV